MKEFPSPGELDLPRGRSAGSRPPSPPIVKGGLGGFVAAALLLLALFPEAACGAAAEAPPPLRVVTFNLFHGGAFSGLNGDDRDLERRLQMVLEELRALRPDVVGLQEASVGRGRGHVASRIARELGFSHAYAPANPRPFGGEWVHQALATLLNFSEGPAIVSRFPILDWQVHDLPRCAGRNGELRTLLSAVLQTPWGTVQAASTHTRGDACQTSAVADRLARGRNGLPGVLMGDFNAVEGSPALAPLRERAAVVDAFRAANPEAAGPTVWQRLDAPEATVYRRVDYIFLVPGQRFAGRVISSRVVLDRPRTLEDRRTLWPSDHYGVLAELDLFSGPLAGPDTAAARRLDTSGTRW